MPLTLQIKNLDKTLQEIKAYPQDIEKIIENEFKVFGVGVVNDAKRNAPVDEGRLRQSISATSGKLSITISVNVDYAAYVEFGTKSFAESYVSTLPEDWQTFAAEFKGSGDSGFNNFFQVIFEWVQRKGFAKDKSAAYAIAKSILIKGIRPHPYLFPAFENNKIELINNLKAQLNAKS